MKKKNPVLDVLRSPLGQLLVFVIVLSAIQFLNLQGMISSSFVQAVGNTLIYSIVAIGFCLLLGYSGLATLGTGGFIGIGTYLAYYIIQEYELPFAAALVLTIAAAVVIGAVVGFISLRIEGIYLAILTLGLSEIIRNLLMVIKSTIKIDVDHVRLFGTKISPTGVYFLILAVFTVLMWLLFNLIDSPTGRAMLAMSSSESLAQAMGVKLLKYRVLAFVIATVYSLLAGVLYVSYMQSSIYATWSSSLAMNILIAACLGGTASPAGVMVGSFVVFTIDYAFLKNITFFQQYPQASLFFNGILIIIIIAKYPGGLIRFLGAVKNKVRSLFAKGRLYRYGPEE